MTEPVDPLERIADALERIAGQSETSGHLATLEAQIDDVIALIENPASTNEDWLELLQELKGEV